MSSAALDLGAAIAVFVASRATAAPPISKVFLITPYPPISVPQMNTATFWRATINGVPARSQTAMSWAL